MGNGDRFLDVLQVVDLSDAVSDTSMKQKDANRGRNGSSKGEEIKETVRSSPEGLSFVSEFVNALRIETIDEVHRPIFVIAAQYPHRRGVLKETEGRQTHNSKKTFITMQSHLSSYLPN